MSRPREYDHTHLLSVAMSAFWKSGYTRTTMDEIVKLTGINRASLYAAYPDKRALFLASLQHYLEIVTANNLQKLAQGANAGESIRNFFTGLIKAPAPASGTASGCLLTNTAIELGTAEEDVAALIRSAFERVEEALCSRLKEARDQGSLAHEADPEKLAGHLLVLIQGMRVMGRLGVDKRVLQQALESALQPLG